MLIIVSSKIDLLIGSLDENLVTNKHFIASRSYHYDYLTWCVQEKKPIPLWLNIFYFCLDWRVYAATITTCTVGAWFMYCLTTKCWSDFLLIIFSLGLALPMPYRPRSISSRMFFGIASTVGIVFATTLNARIIALFTNPIMRSQVESIEQITNGDFHLAGDRYAFLKMSQQTQVNDYQLHLRNILVLI